MKYLKIYEDFTNEDRCNATNFLSDLLDSIGGNEKVLDGLNKSMDGLVFSENGVFIAFIKRNGKKDWRIMYLFYGRVIDRELSFFSTDIIEIIYNRVNEITQIGNILRQIDTN